MTAGFAGWVCRLGLPAGLNCRIDLYEIKSRLRRLRALRAALRAVLNRDFSFREHDGAMAESFSSALRYALGCGGRDVHDEGQLFACLSGYGSRRIVAVALVVFFGVLVSLRSVVC